MLVSRRRKESNSFKTRNGKIIIPANVKHWHVSTKNSWFGHIALEVPGTDTKTEWLEPVTEEEYNKLQEE